jgi:transposase
VLEVGAHSRWSSALIRELGHHCLVANPRHVRLIYAGTHKSDRPDAEALARLGRLDPTLLRPPSSIAARRPRLSSRRSKHAMRWSEIAPGSSRRSVASPKAQECDF